MYQRNTQQTEKCVYLGWFDPHIAVEIGTRSLTTFKIEQSIPPQTILITLSNVHYVLKIISTSLNLDTYTYLALFQRTQKNRKINSFFKQNRVELLWNSLWINSNESCVFETGSRVYTLANNLFKKNTFLEVKHRKWK